MPQWGRVMEMGFSDGSWAALRREMGDSFHRNTVKESFSYYRDKLQC